MLAVLIQPAVNLDDTFASDLNVDDLLPKMSGDS